jgi:ABC-2 type transport system ATP-binding protein
MAGVLVTEHLTKSFGGVRAVDDLSFSVEKGEIFGFLGPNGAGKTTTLRMLLGLAKPDAGRVLVRGVDPLADPSAAHRGLGFLPETLALYRTLTGRQTLRFFAELKGVSRERVDEYLALVGLQEAMDKRVGDYSRGMTQRIGLAQALMGEPDVLVLDEPTGGLDPLAHRQVKDILRDRNRQGATILFSSHVLSEVQELARRVAILRKGRLAAADSVDALRRKVSLQGTLVLTLTNPSPAVAVAVQQVPGVEAARLDGALLIVTCSPELRFDVAKRVEEAGGGVKNMETRDASLEDVFVKLAQEPEGERA